jgi:hypothetical protein
MKPLSAVAVAAGNTSSLVGGTLTYQGLGDWQNVIDVQFPPGAFQANDRISVVVSAVLANPNPGSLGPAPVCVATEVSPVGFVLRARNSSSEGGVASFNWMATAEQPGRVEPVNVRMGRTPPLRYLRNEPPGPGFGVNWQTQLVLFANPLEKTPLVLVTGSDPFGSLAAATWQQLGDTETGVTSPHLAACVGTVLKAEPGGIEIASHNTDCVAGFCGSNYVALSQDPLDTPDLWINAGVVSDGYPFSRQCTDGDWHLIPISFPIPFASPPVVLVTAAGDPGNEPAGEASTPAVVGLATYVTTDYFVLAARNSDSAGGMANFNHIAIGCGVGCGQGPIVESL